MHTQTNLRVIRQIRATTLWRLYRRGHDTSCEIVMLPTGYEGRFLVDGSLLYSYQFTCPDEAVAWAGEKEAQYRQQGWTSWV